MRAVENEINLLKESPILLEVEDLTMREQIHFTELQEEEKILICVNYNSWNYSVMFKFLWSIQQRLMRWIKPWTQKKHQHLQLHQICLFPKEMK